MSVDTRLTGGTVVFPTGTRRADVLIDGERIAGVVDPSTDVHAATEYDVAGKLVFPGIVDPHVHVEDYNTIDDYETASAAAALGGVTTFLNFAWQAWVGEDTRWDEPGTLREAIERHREQGTQSHIDYGLHAVITSEDSAVLAEIGDIIEMGVSSFKMFTAYESGVSYGFLDEAFEEISDHGAVAAVHTEDGSICERRTDRAIEADLTDPTEYPQTRPDYAEALAAQAAVRLALEHGVNYYGVHTTSEAAAAVFEAHANEPTVQAETCTHYTVHDESIYAELGVLPVIAPPLRTPADREAILDHLESGTLSVVSTDHVANTAAKKRETPWWDGPFGANSLQTSFPVFHDVAVNERGFSYPFLARVLSDRPARLFGLSQKGRIEPGMDADLVIFDPDQSYRISASDNASKADFSIYEGREVTGKVQKTFLRGTLIADEGEIVGEPGDGSFQQRDCPDWHALDTESEGTA